MPTIRELLESNFNLHEQAFDGLMGKLPDWVPERDKTRFYDYRRKLQTQHPDSQIIEWMNQCDELAETIKNGLNDAISFDYPPPEVEEEIELLAFFRFAVSCGEIKGLGLLAGKDAVSGMLSRTGYKSGDKYQEKLRFQAAAKPYFQVNDYNIAKTEREPALSEFRKRNYGAHTIRDWLKEIRPKDKGKKGRPRKI